MLFLLIGGSLLLLVFVWTLGSWIFGADLVLPDPDGKWTWILFIILPLVIFAWLVFDIHSKDPSVGAASVNRTQDSRLQGGRVTTTPTRHGSP